MTCGGVLDRYICMIKKEKIFLIGARACGKTSLGKALAKALQWNFVDTDALLQKEAACSVATYVQEHGWAAFRELESQMLQKAAEENCVIATGGGMVLCEKNRLFMRAEGCVFFLQVPVAILAERLRLSPEHGQRPSLTGQGLVEEVAHVLLERNPLYVSTAHVVLEAQAPLDDLVKQAIIHYNSL